MSSSADVKKEEKKGEGTEAKKEETPTVDVGSVEIGTTRVAKIFKVYVTKYKQSKKTFYGTIKEKWEEDGKPRWTVEYDDEDKEDFDEEELKQALMLYEKKKKLDRKIFPREKRAAPKRKAEKPPPPKRTSKYPKRGEAAKN
mmetsp:Transcript_25072/g.43904  ORF Transcript_25072/g.43904 Transcript_25072/m.43904 type:complete len:142 (-) Transcript_25072:302-727(-)